MSDSSSNRFLVKYCEEEGITIKEYPRCFDKKNRDKTGRKNIPPKFNDNVISDHDTSTECSEGEDDAGYIKAWKSSLHDDIKKAKISPTRSKAKKSRSPRSSKKPITEPGMEPSTSSEKPVATPSRRSSITRAKKSTESPK